MYTKVNKVLGYGTDQVQTKFRFHKRVQLPANVQRDKIVQLSVETMWDNEKLAKRQIGEEMLYDEESAEREFAELLWVLDGARDVTTHSNSEHVIVLVPPYCRDKWVRNNNNIIDRLESKQGDSLSFLEGKCIPPYSLGMCRFRGEPRFDWEPKIVKEGVYRLHVGLDNQEYASPKTGDDLRDLKENWRPVLPASIIVWVHLQPWILDKQAFTDMLRPCIYTYWN